MARLLRIALALMWLAGPGLAGAGDASLRSFVALSPAPAAETARDLARLIPGTPAPRPAGEGGFVLGYAGIGLPADLSGFLAHAFPGFAAPAGAVVLSFAVTPEGDGARITLMAEAPGAPPAIYETLFGRPLPEGAETLLSGPSDLVLSLPEPGPEIARNLEAALVATGHSVTASPDSDGTLLLAEAGARAAFVFVRPDGKDPSRSIVVVRTLED